MHTTLNPLSLTREWIGIPSESSGPAFSDPNAPEAAMVNALKGLWDQHGVSYQCENVLPGRDNIAAFFPRPGAPRLLITGHMDTVSAQGEMHGCQAYEKDGLLYGRGACDDKGPLAAAVCALLTCDRQTMAYDTTFLATIGEECGLLGAKAYAEAHVDEPPFDLIIGLEPTRLQTITSHKGSYRFRVTTHGKSCHSSTPELGDNAITNSLPLIKKLQQYGDQISQRHCPRTGHPTLAITKIKGGTAFNIIPETCDLTVDIRTVPGLDGDEIDAALQAMGVSLKDVNPYEFEPAMGDRQPEGPIWERFKNILQADGIDVRPQAVKFCTDCAFLQARGPCVVWGPGDIAQAHTKSEYIAIDALVQATALLKQFLMGRGH